MKITYHAPPPRPLLSGADLVSSGQEGLYANLYEPQRLLALKLNDRCTLLLDVKNGHMERAGTVSGDWVYLGQAHLTLTAIPTT
jgi:hypothetical protein